jgi:ParB-like chromosome segregation protein Spo0J
VKNSRSLPISAPVSSSPCLPLSLSPCLAFMQYRTLPLADLRPAPYNPRVKLKPGTPAWNRLERSLREFDLVQPIVWNERTGHVVGGHQRIEILRHLGHTEVDCIIVDLPLEREKALNVALNNDKVGSEWDPERLVELLDELHAIPDFDVTLTGFDEADLHNLVLAPQPDLPPDDEPDETNLVRVTLEIPADDWDEVRPDLDALLARHRITPHVQLPR